MAEYTEAELQAKILEFLAPAGKKAKNKEIATALGVTKKEVDAAVNDLPQA